MNPHKYSVFFFITKKNTIKKKEKNKLFVEIKYYKFHSIFLKWKWLTIYILSSIYKNRQVPNFFWSLVLHILTPFLFQTYTPAI